MTKRDRALVAGRGDSQNRELLHAVQDMYNAGVRYHSAGQLAMAEQCYRQVLAKDPRHVDSLHLLGVIGHQAGQHSAAAELIRKAIQMNGRDASYHCNLGSVLQAMGRPREAVVSYERALKLNRDHAEAHSNLGNVLQALGKPDEAAAHYRRALAVRPNDPQIHNNFANSLQALYRPEEAVTHYMKALALRPEYAEAHNNIGNVLLSLNRLNEAVEHYGFALTLQPHYPEARNNLGNALEALGRLEEAAASYREALALMPHYAEAHNNLGNVLSSQGKFEEAAAQCGQALALNPSYAAAHNNLGNVFQSLGQLGEAAACYAKALALRPNYAEACMNLGNVFQSQGKLKEAISQYEQALAIKPNYAQAHMNKALTELLGGDLVSGWRGHEWRWRINRPFSPRLTLSQPQWRGEQLNGARILLHAEQGLGDCIQFLRYLPMVEAAGGAVVLEIPEPLRRLAALLPNIEQIVVSGEPRPPIDWHCPLMSLPLAFGTSLDTIPAQVPYLSVPTEAQKKGVAPPWPTEGLRVGLAWAGNPKHLKDRFRSIPFSMIEPLLQTKGVHFFSLQAGKAAGDLSACSGTITDLAPAIADMADTAALIAQLDLVISADTSVAHLAGALGKPVWLLLPYDADWRWLMHREDSPWYPTARLFRQTSPGDWHGVVARVNSALVSTLASAELALT